MSGFKIQQIRQRRITVEYDFANETHYITPSVNTPLNRRHFLRLAALAPLATATPSHALTAIARTGGASFRTGLNAYSFLEQLNANMADANKGERFRHDCVWTVGKGRIFYFRPSHEIYPVFKQAEPLRVVENAVGCVSMKKITRKL